MFGVSEPHVKGFRLMPCDLQHWHNLQSHSNLRQQSAQRQVKQKDQGLHGPSLGRPLARLQYTRMYTTTRLPDIQACDQCLSAL